MADSVVLLLVMVFQQGKVFQGAADSLCHVLLAHEEMEAFHLATGARFALYGQDFEVADGKVIDLGTGAFGRILPIVEIMLRAGIVVFLSKSANKISKM